MDNVIKLFSDYCETKEWVYHYGTSTMLNLIDTGSGFELDADKIYFLNTLNREEPVFNSIGNVTKIKNTGSFLFAVKSDLDKSFYNEKGQLLTSKYVKYIEPLRLHLYQLIKDIACTDNSITSFSMFPAIDEKDINFDGWLINYVIETE
jgi:hypothetical protein